MFNEEVRSNLLEELQESNRLHHKIMQGGELNLSEIKGELQKMESQQLNHQDKKKGLSCIHLAAINGHHHLMRLLIEEKGEIDLQDHFGATALHFAAFLGDFEMIHILKNQGANQYLQTKFGGIKNIKKKFQS